MLYVPCCTYHVAYCSVIRSMFVAIYRYKYTHNCMFINFIESKFDIVIILFHTTCTIKLPQIVLFLIAGYYRVSNSLRTWCIVRKPHYHTGACLGAIGCVTACKLGQPSVAKFTTEYLGEQSGILRHACKLDHSSPIVF